jgi:hypothetical protein
MSPPRTIAIAIVAFGLGVAATTMYSMETARQAKFPLTAKSSPGGVAFQNDTPGSTFVILGLGDQPGSAVQLSRDSTLREMSKNSSAFVAYQVTRSFSYRDGRLAECSPVAECPPWPPPCPPPSQCPWRVVEMSVLTRAK